MEDGEEEVTAGAGGVATVAYVAVGGAAHAADPTSFGWTEDGVDRGAFVGGGVVGRVMQVHLDRQCGS
jgi:hypothetical protein